MRAYNVVNVFDCERVCSSSFAHDCADRYLGAFVSVLRYLEVIVSMPRFCAFVSVLRYLEMIATMLRFCDVLLRVIEMLL